MNMLPSALQDDTWMRARVEADGGRYEGVIEDLKQLSQAQHQALLAQFEKHKTVTGWVDFLHTGFVITMAHLRMEGEELTYHHYVETLINLYPLVTASTQAKIFTVIESIPSKYRRILEWLELFPSMPSDQRELFVEKSLTLAQALTDDYEQEMIYQALLPYLQGEIKQEMQVKFLNYGLSLQKGDVWEDWDAYHHCVWILENVILSGEGQTQKNAINALWDIVYARRHGLFLWLDLSEVMPYLSNKQQGMVCQSLVEYVRLVCEEEVEINSFYGFNRKFPRIFPYFSDEQRVLTLNQIIAFGKSRYWPLDRWLEAVPAYIPAEQRKQILEIFWDRGKEKFYFPLNLFNNILPYSTEVEQQWILDTFKTLPNYHLLLTHTPLFWATLDEGEYRIWIQKFQYYLLENHMHPKYYEVVSIGELLGDFYGQIPLFPSGIFQAQEIDQIAQNLIQVCTRWKWP